MATIAVVWIEMLSVESGGRKSPVSVGYRPHFRVRGGDGEYLGIEFVEFSEEPVQPGASVRAKVELVYEPEVDYSALVAGAEFDIMEGSRVVGSGCVRSYP